jgi:hypothetical protein
MTLLQARAKARADERTRLWRNTREQLREDCRQIAVQENYPGVDPPPPAKDNV